MGKTPKLRMMPADVEAWQSSTQRAKSKDYQRSWFWELIFHMWANQRKPGYLPLDGQLWTLAGAHSKAFFDRESAVVMAAFKVVEFDGMKWICHEGLLKRMKKSVDRYNSKKPKIEATTNVYVSDSDLKEFSELKTKDNPDNGFSLPAWVPEKAWLAFEEMRVQIKPKLTDIGRERLVLKLARLKEAGYNVEIIIYEAVMRGWRSFFAVEDALVTQKNQPVGRQSAGQARTERTRSVLSEALRERHGDSAVAGPDLPADADGDHERGVGPLLVRRSEGIPDQRD